MANLTGIPKVVSEVSDKSLLFNRESTFNYCVQGETARGEIGKPIFVRNEIEFKRELGGRIEHSDFPLYCIRMLNAGCRLWVSRVGHYTDITDKLTKTGTKGTGSATNGLTAEVRAKATGTITNAGTVANTFTVTADGKTLGVYNVEASDTVADVTTGIATAIGSNPHGYTVGVVTPLSGTFEVVAPVGSGTTPNTTALTITVTGGGTAAATNGTFTGGVAGTLRAATFIAEEVGSGYNGTTITISASNSGNVNTVDISVTAKDSDTSESVADVPLLPTSQQIIDYNKLLKFVKINTVTGGFPLGTITIAGGVFDVTTITDNDYIGDAVAKTGWHSFGKVTNAFRILNINRPSRDVDAAMAAYAISRGNMRFHIGTPIGVTPDGALDYRNGTGIYTGSAAINDWRGSLWSGQVNINDPADTKIKLDIPGIVDFAGRRALVDSNPRYGVWWTAAGGERGVIASQNNGVGEVNFLAPEYATSGDDAFKGGVNAIGVDETFGTVVWGNSSLSKNKTSLLSKENVADLAMYVRNRLIPLTRIELFNPNDPIMWRSIYRRVNPFITKELVDGRAIRPGENEQWIWMGDQDIDKAQNAVFNKQSDLNNGIYKCRFVFVPITATEFIGIDVTVTDSESFATVVQNPFN